MFTVLILSYFVIAAIVVAWVIRMFRSYDDFQFHSNSRPMPSHIHIKNH